MNSVSPEREIILDYPAAIGSSYITPETWGDLELLQAHRSSHLPALHRLLRRPRLDRPQTHPHVWLPLLQVLQFGGGPRRAGERGTAS